MNDEVDFFVELENGKYTFIAYKNGRSEALRYGEKWRDLTGDNLVYLLASKVNDLSIAEETEF